VRLYESEGSTAHTELYIPGAQSITPANLLEQPVGGTVPGERVSLSFRPFEIQTMLVRY
jgi:alpha-mannosidase